MSQSTHRKLVVCSWIAVILVLLVAEKFYTYNTSPVCGKIVTLKQLVMIDDSLIFEEKNGEEMQHRERIPAELTPFFFEKIPLCRAGEELLQTIPGVGPSTAAAIKRYVDQNGTPATHSGLGEIDGIGPQKIALLQTKVSLCNNE